MNNDPRPAQEKSSKAEKDFRKPVRASKALIAMAVLILLGGTGALYYVHRQSQPVSILINGKPVTTLPNYRAAANALIAAEEKKCHGDFPADSFILLQNVRRVRMPDSTPTDNSDTAVSRLQKALKVHVHAYVIMVDGKPTIGLPTSEAAGQTLTKLKNHFEGMPPNGEVLGEPDFAERVIIQKMAINPAQTCASSDDAAAYFTTPPTIRTTIVKPHETGFAIAHKNHIPFGEFLAANRGRNIDRLQPGDTVNLERPRLRITVQVKKQVGQDEKIIANASEADAGKRHVTYIVTYANGEESKREATHVVTLARPKPRRSL